MNARNVFGDSTSLGFRTKKSECSVYFRFFVGVGSRWRDAVSKCFNAEHLYAVQRSAVFVVFLIVVDTV